MEAGIMHGIEHRDALLQPVDVMGKYQFLGEGIDEADAVLISNVINGTCHL